MSETWVWSSVDGSIQKDITDQIKNLIKNNILFIKASNNNFQDICPNILKKVTKFNNGNKIQEWKENDIIILKENQHERLGIFYTNNNKHEKILDSSINSITKAKNFNRNIDIVVSSWSPMVGDFWDIDTCFKTTLGNLNVALQILESLSKNNIGKYKIVSFLEHDVLYPEDYFNRIPLSLEGVFVNYDYIGMCEMGYQRRNQKDAPLHQISMNFDYALSHFTSLIPKFLGDVTCLLEPATKDAISYDEDSGKPSVHINEKNHLTSHYDIYSKNDCYKVHNYWGDYLQYYPKESIKV